MVASIIATTVLVTITNTKKYPVQQRTAARDASSRRRLLAQERVLLLVCGYHADGEPCLRRAAGAIAADLNVVQILYRTCCRVELVARFRL